MIKAYSQTTIVDENCYFSDTNIGNIGNENVIMPSKQAEEFTLFLDIFTTRSCDFLGEEESSETIEEESSVLNEEESSETIEEESSVLNDEEPNDPIDDDLSAGEIAGISIPCMVVVIIIVGLIVYFMRKRKRTDEEKSEKNSD